MPGALDHLLVLDLTSHLSSPHSATVARVSPFAVVTGSRNFAGSRNLIIWSIPR